MNKIIIFIKEQASIIVSMLLGIISGTILTQLLYFHNMTIDGFQVIVTLSIGIITIWVIYNQVRLLRNQIQLQTLTDLVKDWDSKDMIENRRAAVKEMKKNDKDVNFIEPNRIELNRIEPVLEFLERVSTFEKNKILDEKLIWDTLGWYILRYYYYNKENILNMRNYWAEEDKKEDPTLYKDLKDLYIKLKKREIEERNRDVLSSDEKIDETKFEKELADTKKKFIESELYY